jgi:ribosome-associated protein
MIRIDGRLSIPEEELVFRFAPSSGPGGQHVNRASTRVTLLFDVAGSPSLSAAQKDRIRERLATRINLEGVLRVVCGRHRSQAANRRETVDRFAGLLRQALQRDRPRRKTSVPAGERRRRIEEKKRRGGVKKTRKRVSPQEE